MSKFALYVGTMMTPNTFKHHKVVGLWNLTFKGEYLDCTLLTRMKKVKSVL